MHLFDHMHNVVHRVYCFVQHILLHTCAVNCPWLNEQQLIYKSVCVYDMQRATVGDFHKARHCCRTVAAHWPTLRSKSPQPSGTHIVRQPYSIPTRPCYLDCRCDMIASSPSWSGILRTQSVTCDIYCSQIGLEWKSRLASADQCVATIVRLCTLLLWLRNQQLRPLPHHVFYSLPHRCQSLWQDLQ